MGGGSIERTFVKLSSQAPARSQTSPTGSTILFSTQYQSCPIVVRILPESRLELDLMMEAHLELHPMRRRFQVGNAAKLSGQRFFPRDSRAPAPSAGILNEHRDGRTRFRCWQSESICRNLLYSTTVADFAAYVRGKEKYKYAHRS